MGQMKLPIIIAEGWDVILYDKIQDAELDLEPIDVKDGIYKGYDAEGRLLRISTDGKKVRIFAVEDEHTHAKELEDFLRECLEKVSEKAVADQSPDLASLLKACERFVYVPPRTFKEVLRRLVKKFFMQK